MEKKCDIVPGSPTMFEAAKRFNRFLRSQAAGEMGRRSARFFQDGVCAVTNLSSTPVGKRRNNESRRLDIVRGRIPMDNTDRIRIQILCIVITRKSVQGYFQGGTVNEGFLRDNLFIGKQRIQWFLAKDAMSAKKDKTGNTRNQTDIRIHNCPVIIRYE